MTIPELLSFLDTAKNLKTNTRHSWTSKDRQESVAEHSYMVALMALLLKDNFPNVDINKVISMCLVHDLGEAVTGDIPSFKKTSDHRKVEDTAVSNLLSTLPVSNKAEFTELFDEMAKLDTDEAKLFKALDRVEAVIQHNQAPLSSWIPLEYELNLTYGEDECKEFEFMQELRDILRTQSIEKIQNGN